MPYFFAMLSLSTASLGWSGAVGDSIENLNNKIHDLYEKGRFLEAHPLAERLLELAEASHEPQEISTALNNLADIERILGQFRPQQPWACNGSRKFSGSLSKFGFI